VVAVDLPSGWDADSMEQSADGAFRADAVVTFTAPKLAHVFGHLTPGKSFGPVVVAPVGTPEIAIQSETRLHWAGAAKTITEKRRDVNGNKGKFGHVLLLGGAFGKAGAPSMASLAAMRAGAGLVTAAVPREILPTVAAVAPELMLTPLEPQGPGSRIQGSEGKIGGLELDQLDDEPLQQLLKGITVAGIGPGLGQEGTTPEWVRMFVERVTLPMVIDADALNALAGHTALLKSAAKSGERTIVLTPHPGEMARLAGMTVKQVEADRVGLARSFATEYGVTLVLKGWRTLIAHPDGRISVNTTGNPAMAKGGSGDILTGIVASMLAQYGDEHSGGDVACAVEAAVFLHGLAGDFATLAQDEHTVLATDTVRHLSEAFRARVMDADGFTWIAGLAAKGPRPRDSNCKRFSAEDAMVAQWSQGKTTVDR
jgi:NAD(P)H-hydrate epimerase